MIKLIYYSNYHITRLDSNTHKISFTVQLLLEYSGKDYLKP